MLGNKSRMLLQSIKTFVARDARAKLVKIVEKAHPADLGLIFGHLRLSEARKVIECLPNAEEKAHALSETDPELAAAILRESTPRAISTILQEMYSDDSAFILEQFDEELRSAILHEMKDDESREVEKRLEFAEDTAGRLMVPDFLALSAETTVAEAIAALQDARDLELVYYLYVVSETGQLVGVVSLRQLLLVGPRTRLADIMVKDVITARVHEDQEDVARRVARYNLVAIPVVDDLGRIVGIVTVDDVIDVIKEEATEDMLMMAGTSAEDPLVSGSVLTSVKLRSPWLLTSFLGGLFAFAIIHQYEDALVKAVMLAGLIPIVLGLGGNVGAQSSTMVARGLSTSVLDTSQVLKVTLKELRIGALLGLIYGGLLALVLLALPKVGLLGSPDLHLPSLAAVAGVGILASTSVAAIIGALIPMLLDRLRVDPAIATGPLVTSALDAIGVLVYFAVATLLLDL
jgi:magnesium transporter